MLKIIAFTVIGIGLGVVALSAIDLMLFKITTDRYGPQWHFWPGSGFYVWWKHRRGRK